MKFWRGNSCDSATLWSNSLAVAAFASAFLAKSSNAKRCLIDKSKLAQE
jgi:hypothetical protein